MPASIKMALLQNAVKDIPHLSIVEILDDYTSTTSGTGPCTHHTYTSCYSLLINACFRYDATNTSTHSKRSNVYASAGAHDLNGIAEPHRTQFSPDIDTPSDGFYQVHQAKHHKQPCTPLSGFHKDHHRNPTLLYLRSHLRNVMVLFMFLLKYINSSVLRLLLPSRNIILGPSTSFPKRGMSLILLIMNQPHQRIPFMRSNQTLNSLRMHLKMRLTHFWTTTTFNITRKKI